MAINKEATAVRRSTASKSPARFPRPGTVLQFLFPNYTESHVRVNVFFCGSACPARYPGGNPCAVLRAPAVSMDENLSQRLGLPVVQPGDVVDAPGVVDLDEIEGDGHQLIPSVPG